MAKKKKYEEYLKEFKSKRTAQIPYDIYVKILHDEFNAEEGKRSHSSGSKRAFKIGNSVFVIHEPHKKGNNVGKWDHQNIYDLLKRTGALKDENENN
jgi:hypothetical protein